MFPADENVLRRGGGEVGDGVGGTLRIVPVAVVIDCELEGGGERRRRLVWAVAGAVGFEVLRQDLHVIGLGERRAAVSQCRRVSISAFQAVLT